MTQYATVPHTSGQALNSMSWRRVRSASPAVPTRAPRQFLVPARTRKPTPRQSTGIRRSHPERVNTSDRDRWRSRARAQRTQHWLQQLLRRCGTADSYISFGLGKGVHENNVSIPGHVPLGRSRRRAIWLPPLPGVETPLEASLTVAAGDTEGQRVTQASGNGFGTLVFIEPPTIDEGTFHCVRAALQPTSKIARPTAAARMRIRHDSLIRQPGIRRRTRTSRFPTSPPTESACKYRSGAKDGALGEDKEGTSPSVLSDLPA